jgi:hypothetical protein
LNPYLNTSRWPFLHKKTQSCPLCEEGVLSFFILSNARDLVIASKQTYIIKAKDLKYRKGACFPTFLPFFLKYFFEATYEKPAC